MAKAFLKQYGGELFNAESAGLEPGKLNPNVVKVMQEIGIDISANKTQGTTELLQAGRKFDMVVTVCDGASAEACPIFPGQAIRLGWSFTDPSKFSGSPDEILSQTRIVRDEIKQAIWGFVKEYGRFDNAKIDIL